MARIIIALYVLTAAGTLAPGDELILVDGRTFSGTVTVGDKTVTIEMAYGSLQFSRDKILRIEFTPTPEMRLERRMEQIDPGDADALYEVARWAEGEGIRKRPQELYEQVIKLEPEHPGARRALGFMLIDRKWRRFPEAFELAHSKLEAGQDKLLLDGLLSELEEIAPSLAKRVEARELLGLTQLRAKRFAAAGKTFADLAGRASSPSRLRYAAIADLLAESQYGMYVLTEQFPPGADLLAGNERTVPAGPASLADPLVLQAALRDRAKREIETGRKLLTEAKPLELTNADAADVKYQRALLAFDRADAVVAGIAKSYRIEIARRRIAMIRRDADEGAKKFDTAVEKLGKQDVDPRDYRTMLLRLVNHLDGVRNEMKEILTIAEPYPYELVMEISWAKSDLSRLDEARNVLMAELRGER